LNIVFDLGGVIFKWEPAAIIAGVFPDPAEQALVRTQLFKHPDWSELDRGTLAQPEAIARAVTRTGLAETEIAELMRRIPPALIAIPAMIDLLHRLREGGHRLYFLSNMQAASIEHLEQANHFWDVFDGGVISCRLQQIKPEPGIYRHLLETYHLVGAETLFIDDTEINLPPAEQLGIRTLHFESPAQCEARLRELGVIPVDAM